MCLVYEWLKNKSERSLKKTDSIKFDFQTKFLLAYAKSEFFIIHFLMPSDQGRRYEGVGVMLLLE